MERFDVLSPETNIFGRYFLEASAGTGKTFAIENIVPRLLLESSDVTIDKILVVTFTRAATRELKARIYKNLLSIANALEQGKGGPPYLEKIIRGGKEVLSTAKRKVEEALFSFEKAQIHTLHGFCLHVLQEFAFETGFFLKSEGKRELGEEEIRVYLKDFFRRGLTFDLLSPGQIRMISNQRQIGKDIEALLDEILKVLEKEQEIRPSLSAKEEWLLWNTAYQEFPRLSKETLLLEFSLTSSRLAKSTKWSEQVDLFFQAMEKGGCSFAEWDFFVQEKELFLHLVKEPPKKNSKEIQYPGLFERIKERFLPLHKDASDQKALLLRLVSSLKKHYEKGKEDLAYFTPDDFVVKLKRAIAKEEIASKVRSRYQALIIDEFQDTDPDQWAIFQSLFLDKDALPILYLVGDPKQSIYGFRNADVYIYLKAKGLLDEKSHFYLGTNFRSHPDLVKALNALFSEQLPEKWMLLPYEKEALEVRSVLAKPVSPSFLDAEKSKGRVHFFIKEEEAEVEEDFLIPYIALEILRLQKECAISFKQVAVLVKDRFQGDRLQKGLSAYGIPSFLQKSFDVKGLAYETMKEFLEALRRPSNISCVKKLLGGLFMGYSSLEIEGSWEVPLLQNMREYLVEASAILQKKGFGVVFSEFLLSPSKFPDKTIAEELLGRKNSNLYAELRQLFQIVLESAPSDLYDADALLLFLEKLQDLDSSDERLKQLSEQEEDQVQVMTLHKSKGLEFEIVFALALVSRHKGKDSYISIRGSGGRELIAAQEEEASYIFHTEEVDAEKLRQLYVALTRAKERVYIPYIIASNQKEIKRGSLSALDLFLGGFGLETYSFDEVYQRIASLSLADLLLKLDLLTQNVSMTYEALLERPLPFKAPSHQITLYPPKPYVFSFTESFLLSFSSLSEGHEISPLEKSEIPLLIPPGAETGTVIHDVLEALCKADLHRDRGAAAFSLIQRGCKSTVLEGLEKAVFSLIDETFTTEITTPFGVFTLADIPSFDMQTEMEFLYPVGESFLKGFIDCVFRYQGKYFLLDWKTNVLGFQKEDYTLEKVEECMEESQYTLQAAIYTVALQKILALCDERDFSECFGGVIYFFLRGVKPLFFQPDVNLVKEALEGRVYA
jgi:exodeoxyribonuclease V beta subunit